MERIQAEDHHGGGTGLGLSIVTDIVRLHGGTLRIHTASEGGACIRIRLPAVRPPD